MFSLAPKVRSIGLFHITSTTEITRDIIKRKEKQEPRIFSASSLSPLPMAMEAFGAPPLATKDEKADTTIMMGKHTPTPVNARLPSPGI